MASEGKSTGRGGCLKRLFWIGIVLMLLVLAGFYFVARTDRFRRWSEKRVGAMVGQTVTIGRTGLGWPCDLILADVTSAGYANARGAAGGFHVDEARLRPAGLLRMRLNLRGWEARVVRAGRGRWTPECLALLGALHGGGIADIADITRPWRAHLTLDAERGAVRWVSAEGLPLAGAEGVVLLVRPVALPGRRLAYHRLGVARMTAADGATVHDIEREWLCTDMRAYVEIGRAGEEPQGLLRAFWEGH